MADLAVAVDLERERCSELPPPGPGYIRIDARELSQTEIRVNGRSIDTRATTELLLSPGEYSFAVGEGLLSSTVFRVTQTGVVDYLPSPITPGPLSGRGSQCLVIGGFSTTITMAVGGKGLTLAGVFDGPYALFTSFTNPLRLLPVRASVDSGYHLAAEWGPADRDESYFGIDEFGTYTYDKRFDSNLAGRGSPSLYSRRQ